MNLICCRLFLLPAFVAQFVRWHIWHTQHTQTDIYMYIWGTLIHAATLEPASSAPIQTKYAAFSILRQQFSSLFVFAGVVIMKATIGACFPKQPPPLHMPPTPGSPLLKRFVRVSGCKTADCGWRIVDCGTAGYGSISAKGSGVEGRGEWDPQPGVFI